MMVQVGATKYLECSAKTGDGVSQVFAAAAKLALFPKKRLSQKCKMI